MELDRDEIARKMTEKGATRPCHRCGKSAFTVLEGFSNIMIQKKLNSGIAFGGPTVPVAHIVCNNCGAVTPHALGALDMLPREEENGGE